MVGSLQLKVPSGSKLLGVAAMVKKERKGKQEKETGEKEGRTETKEREREASNGRVHTENEKESGKEDELYTFDITKMIAWVPGARKK